MVYAVGHSALIVGGASQQLSGSDVDADAAAAGVTVWRVLSDAPYYKLISDTDSTIAVSSLVYFFVFVGPV